MNTVSLLKPGAIVTGRCVTMQDTVTGPVVAVTFVPGLFGGGYHVLRIDTGERYSSGTPRVTTLERGTVSA